MDKLLILNDRGLIPGPDESEKSFLTRSDFNLAACCLPCSSALQRVSEIFYIKPDWVEVDVQSKGLYPWEGAAAWIEQKENGVRRCRIQIKDSFFSRFYAKEELIAHEMVHAVRVMFDESRFEEILAYRTSKNLMRRYCGPFFQGSKEALVFLVLVFVPWVAWMAEICMDIEIGAGYLFCAPLSVLAWGIFRLMRSQSIFSATLENLEKSIVKKGKSLSVALGLTDAEIELFAKLKPDEILSFANRQKGQSIRWKQLYIAYFC